MLPYIFSHLVEKIKQQPSYVLKKVDVGFSDISHDTSSVHMSSRYHDIAETIITFSV